MPLYSEGGSNLKRKSTWSHQASEVDRKSNNVLSSPHLQRSSSNESSQSTGSTKEKPPVSTTVPQYKKSKVEYRNDKPPLNPANRGRFDDNGLRQPENPRYNKPPRPPSYANKDYYEGPRGRNNDTHSYNNHHKMFRIQVRSLRRAWWKTRPSFKEHRPPYNHTFKNHTQPYYRETNDSNKNNRGNSYYQGNNDNGNGYNHGNGDDATAERDPPLGTNNNNDVNDSRAHGPPKRIFKREILAFL